MGKTMGQDMEAIRHYKGTVQDFKNFFDQKAAETANKDKENTNAFGTPEYQGFNDVHPTRGANKSPHWKESVNEDKEVTQEMWDKEWKIRKTFGKEYDEHFAKRIEAAMSKAKDEEMAENWAFINWKQLPGKADGMTIKESVNEAFVLKLTEVINEAAIDGDRQMITRAIENMASGRLKVKDITREIGRAIDQANISSTMKEFLKYAMQIKKESVNELKAAPRSDKAIKDLEKQGSEINYLDDADPATKKIWKKAGINPDDQNTVILYSYVAHPWEDIKNILTKHSIDFKELEDPNSAGESMIVFIEESVNLTSTKADRLPLFEDFQG